MKKITLTLIVVLSAFQFTYAQALWAASGNNIYNTNTGSVGIGTSIIDRLLTVSSNGTGIGTAQARFSSYSSTQSDASVILFSKAAGSISSPLPVSTGDVLGVIQSQGWTTGTGFINGASITFNGVGAAGGRTPTDIIFNVPTNTADVQALAIKSGGYVGVGTTSPYQTFDVIGSSGTLSSTAKINAAFEQDHTNYRGILLGYDSSDQIGVIAGAANGANSNIAFWSSNAGIWSEAMRLNPTGNLGIGTSAPASRLQVMGSVIASGIHCNLDPNGGLGTLPNTLANTGQMLVGWNRLAGNGETDFIANQGPGTMGGFAFFNHDNSNNETLAMWIQGSGNVLIGEKTQVNTAYKLDVNGSGRFNSVVVNTTGADFVFDPTYRLLHLTDLKKYIDQNHHLPEIASAKEMQTNGLNVGDNQIKLLQKVEELTLYLIEKDNQLKQQQATIAAQNDKLKSEQGQIDLLTQQMAAVLKQLNQKQ